MGEWKISGGRETVEGGMGKDRGREERGEGRLNGGGVKVKGKKMGRKSDG